jgi:C-terminal processing protease CtpA/Prc
MAVLTGILLMAAACAARASNNLSVLDQVWTEARAHVHPASLVDSHFTNETRRELEQAAGSAPDVYAWAPSINAFLATLGRSHTGFYTDRDLDFYLYRSMFTTRDPAEPPVYHAGLQHWHRDGEWVVREVWDGLPGHRAGLRRGDVVISANGRPGTAFSLTASSIGRANTPEPVASGRTWFTTIGRWWC